MVRQLLITFIITFLLVIYLKTMALMKIKDKNKKFRGAKFQIKIYCKVSLPIK